MTTKTVVFLGASTGVGLSALKSTLAAGHKCIAICRNPSKLTDLVSPAQCQNLQVIQGNAHDLPLLAKCVRKPDGRLVDGIVSTIGGRIDWSKMSFDDLFVCRKGMDALLGALAEARRDGAAGRPFVVAFSTTGMSKFGRDVPVAMVPFYHVLLKKPHEDKGGMEDKLANSDEDFTIVRASLLLDGERNKPITVGVEDPKTGRESSTIGYFISREDAGKWVAENIVIKTDPKYRRKIATITN